MIMAPTTQFSPIILQICSLGLRGCQSTYPKKTITLSFHGLQFTWAFLLAAVFFLIVTADFLRNFSADGPSSSYYVSRQVQLRILWSGVYMDIPSHLAGWLPLLFK
jgi:hypothetical protein